MEDSSNDYSLWLMGDHREFLCGWLASSVNITLTFPINKLIFRQMLHGVGTRSALLQMVDEGLFSLYRGVLPPLLQKSVSSSLMFGMYDAFNKAFLKADFNPLTSSILSALLAGNVEGILTPFERVQTVLQDGAYQKQFVNTKHVANVLRSYGLREYYRGLTPILLRNGPANSIFFVMREKMNACTMPQSMWGLHGAKQFLIGASIGAVNSAIFYPLNVVKVHMQSRLGGPFQSTLAAFKEVYVQRDRKIRNFYKGVHMSYTRSFIGWGIINFSYEHFKRLITEE